MEGNALRGVVAEKFGSCEKFAKELKWSGRKTRDIVSGRQWATTKEVREMADALQISDAAEFLRVFFPQ